tara:strand:+ start:149 stop:451 length:303 start_codon:yes stop_codon:yes gene_type:complete
MSRKKAEKLLADGHIDQKDFDAMFPDVDDDTNDVLLQEPDMFLANVIAECADLSIAAKRRIARSKAADARLYGVLARLDRDRAAAKSWYQVAYELRTLRS